MQKSLTIKAFHYWFIPSFLCFYQQSYTLGGSLLPYRFVVNSLLYDSYPMGRTSASTSLMPQLVQAVIPPQHVVIASMYIIERYPNDMSFNDTMIQNKQIKLFYFTRLSIIGISKLLKIYTINKVFYHLNIQWMQQRLL